MKRNQIRQLKTFADEINFPGGGMRGSFQKVRLEIIGAVDLWGKSKVSPVKESSKNWLMNRSNVISLEVETWISMEVEKVFAWKQIIVETSLKVETSSLEVLNGTYLLTDNNCEISPEVEVRMKMQA